MIRQTAAKRRTVKTSKPVAPRIEGGLGAAARRELLDDVQWTQLEITADLTGAALRGMDIAECRFIGCRLTGADLQGSRFVDVVFVDCELSGAMLADVVMTRVEMRNCRMSGVVLTTAKLRDVSIVECRADGLSARMASAERMTIERSQLRDADFYGARLDTCRLFDCDLGSVEFSKATFRDVRLHGSDLSGLRGIEHVRGVAIDHEQMHDFAMSLLAAHRVTVETAREPESPTC